MPCPIFTLLAEISKIPGSFSFVRKNDLLLPSRPARMPRRIVYYLRPYYPSPCGTISALIYLSFPFYLPSPNPFPSLVSRGFSLLTSRLLSSCLLAWLGRWTPRPVVNTTIDPPTNFGQNSIKESTRKRNYPSPSRHPEGEGGKGKEVGGSRLTPGGTGGRM